MFLAVLAQPVLTWPSVELLTGKVRVRALVCSNLVQIFKQKKGGGERRTSWNNFQDEGKCVKMECGLCGFVLKEAERQQGAVGCPHPTQPRAFLFSISS